MEKVQHLWEIKKSLNSNLLETIKINEGRDKIENVVKPLKGFQPFEDDLLLENSFPFEDLSYDIFLEDPSYGYSPFEDDLTYEEDLLYQEDVPYEDDLTYEYPSHFDDI